MSKFEVLDRIAAEGNGYLRTRQVLESGISKPTLADYVSKHKFEHIGQGLYRAEDAWPDEMYQLSLLNSRIVFSHESALLLHGLTEREPVVITVTVRAGYNATHLRRQGIRVFQVKPEVAELGILDVKTAFGNIVRTYNMERTICDIIRNKGNMDIQVFQYAMKEYMTVKKKNLHNLMTYAKVFGIEKTVRTYTEVML